MKDRMTVTGCSVCACMLIVLWEAATSSARADSSPTLSAPAAASTTAGTLLPLTLSPRVNAERAAVAMTSGYDGANASATLVTTVDVKLAKPLGLRAGFMYMPDASGKAFQPHVGLRWQLLTQEGHGLDAAVGVFYRMERFTEDEGTIQVFVAGARRFEKVSLFANLAYGQDPEGDDRDGDVRIAALYSGSPRLQGGVDGWLRFDVMSTDTRRSARGTTDLEFATGPLATLAIDRFAIIGQAGIRGIQTTTLRMGLLATIGVASVF